MDTYVIEFDVIEAYRQSNRHWHMEFPPWRLHNVFIMKTKVSSFLDQFVCSVQS